MKKNFTIMLQGWHEKHKEFLAEKTVSSTTGKLQNTTNSIEGEVFLHMKSMVSLHRGLTKSMKLSLVDFYLMNLGHK